MLIGRSVFTRFVPLLLFAGAVLLLALVLASLRFATLTRQSSHEALDAARLNNRAMQLLTLVQDAETSQRGYLITGEEKYLGPLKRAQALIALHFLSVSGDMMKAGISHVTVERLKRLVDDKLGEMRDTIGLKKAGRDAEAIAVVQTDSGKRVIVAGLDMDYMGKPFGCMPQLMAVAEYVTKVHAICMVCGEVASHSYRLSPSNERVLLGETDLYEARCRRCFNLGEQV